MMEPLDELQARVRRDAKPYKLAVLIGRDREGVYWDTRHYRILPEDAPLPNLMGVAAISRPFIDATLEDFEPREIDGPALDDDTRAKLRKKR